MTHNAYAALLEVLRPEEPVSPMGLFGTLVAVSPLTVRIRGTDISSGLFYPLGTVFYPEHIGRSVALLPCEEGFLILFQVQGGSV